MVVLGILLLVGLLFYQVFAVNQKRTYQLATRALPEQQKDFERIKDSNRDIKFEWSQWDEARRALVDLESDYFYRGKDSINQLRLDLRKIIQATGIRVVSDLIFDYADWEEENLKRVRVNFTMSGSYMVLKRFIHQIEILPKFLMVERIDFRDIDTQSGRIELSVVLAGYYEN